MGGALAGWFLGPLVYGLWTKVSAPGDRTAWYLTRSVATVAYLVLTGSVVWGLALTTRVVKAAVSAPLAMALHSVLSWLGLGLGGLHAVLLLLDHYYSYTLGDILIPFTGPYRPFWVGLGVISLYASAIVSFSFAMRKWVGYRTWRGLHYLSFPAFVLVTLHGLVSGSDSSQLSMQLMYLVCGALVLVLTLARIVQAPAPAKVGADRLQVQRDAVRS
jgi:cytochrome b561